MWLELTREDARNILINADYIIAVGPPNDKTAIYGSDVVCSDGVLIPITQCPETVKQMMIKAGDSVKTD